MYGWKMPPGKDSLGPGKETDKGLVAQGAFGHVDDPEKSCVIVQIGEQVQVGHHILHLPTAPEWLAAKQDVRDACNNLFVRSDPGVCTVSPGAGLAAHVCRSWPSGCEHHR